MMEKVIDVSKLYEGGNAKLSKLTEYVVKAQELAGEGNDVVITGAGPVWLYLKIAHALHGKVRRLIYRSPVTGDVEVFNHSVD